MCALHDSSTEESSLGRMPLVLSFFFLINRLS